MYKRQDIIYNHKSNRELHAISKVSYKRYWSKILEDLYKVSLAISILELTDKTLSDNDPHPPLFLVLKEVLAAYNNTLINPKVLFWFYECALLSNLGFQSSLEDPDLPGLILPEIKNEFGVEYCNITRCCTEVCPAGIQITDDAIIQLKERVVDRYYDPLQRIWRAITGKKVRM